MNTLATNQQILFLIEAKAKIDAAFNSENPLPEDKYYSNLIFRRKLDANQADVINAHVQAIHKHINKLFAESHSIKIPPLVLEFSKSIAQFDSITKHLNINGGVYGDNCIASQYFYINAVSAFRECTPNLYQGDMDFACIPLKLRLAIEIYFKNMIGYVSSEQTHLTGHKKGSKSPYPLSIADLLKFFNDKYFNKYIKSPIQLEVLMDINYWSNNLMHTGIISFAWQNLTAIDLLMPLFTTQHQEGAIDIQGFNYLSPDHDLKDLQKDLNTYLSNQHRRVDVTLLNIKDKPAEGSFYYPRKLHGV